jgi:Tfp pilus assembly protein PilF
VKATKTTRKQAVSAEPARSPSWLWPFAGALMIALVAYWPALNGPFIFDDIHLPFNDPNAATAGPRLWLGGVRPLLMLTYWINFLVSGTHAISYHVGNLLLHALTAVLVFFILRRLLDLANIQLDHRLSALFGAGLFLLHPLQTESVAYVAGRSEVVAGLFYAAAWLVFLNHFKAPTTVWTAIQIMLLTGAGLLGKESAISVPAILFLTDLYWNPATLGQQVRSRLKLYVPILAGGFLAALYILRGLASATSAGFGVTGLTPATYALTQCRVILTYIRLFIFPVGQNGDWGLPFFHSLTDGGAWIYVLAMAGFIALIAWTCRRAKLLSFGLLVFLVLLLPTSSVVPIKDAIAERRVYVPIIGLILASIWALDFFRPRMQTFRTIAACVLVLAAALTFERNEVWSSDLLLWQDSAKKSPLNGRAHMGLGDAYLVRGRCADAAKEFEAVQRYEGPSDEMTTNLAASYQCNHQTDLALKTLRGVVARRPNAGFYAQIGYLEALLNHGDESMAALNQAIALDPRNALAYAYRGVLYITLGDRTKALADLQHSLEIAPGNKTAADGLAMLLRQR